MTVDSFHGVGRGSSNAEERWHHAAQELARARARNRTQERPFLLKVVEIGPLSNGLVSPAPSRC